MKEIIALETDEEDEPKSARKNASMPLWMATKIRFSYNDDPEDEDSYEEDPALSNTMNNPDMMKKVS